MKSFFNTTVFLFLMSSCLDVMAVCSGQVVDPRTVLTPSVKIVAASGGDSWNEVHCADGQLWDEKQGAGDPVDPSGFVGSWSMTSDSVTHSYDQAYTYQLRRSGSPANPNYCLDGAEDFDISLSNAPNNACTP